MRLVIFFLILLLIIIVSMMFGGKSDIASTDIVLTDYEEQIRAINTVMLLNALAAATKESSEP